MASTAVAQPATIKEGWIYKKGHSDITQLFDWHHRFFILKENGQFIAFRSKPVENAQDLNVPVNNYTVKGCQIMIGDKVKGFKFVIRLLHLTKQKMVDRNFYVESEQEREEWLQAIEGVKQRLEAELSTETDPSEKCNTPAPDLFQKLHVQVGEKLQESGNKKVEEMNEDTNKTHSQTTRGPVLRNMFSIAKETFDLHDDDISQVERELIEDKKFSLGVTMFFISLFHHFKDNPLKEEQMIDITNMFSEPDFLTKIDVVPPQCIRSSRDFSIYLEEMLSSGSIQEKGVPVFTIGNQGAGKTSVSLSLKFGKFTTSDTVILHPETKAMTRLDSPASSGTTMKNTKVIQLYEDIILNDAEDVSITKSGNVIDVGGKLQQHQLDSINLRLFDFGGHQEYQFITPIFLKKKSLCILTFDAGAYVNTASNYSKEVGQHIETLAMQNFDGVIIIVANKIYENSNGIFKGENILQSEKAFLEKVQDHVQERWEHVPHQPQIVNNIFKLSPVMDMANFYSTIKAIVNDTQLFPTEAAYPLKWKTFRDKMIDDATEGKGFLIKSNALDLYKLIDINTTKATKSKSFLRHQEEMLTRLNKFKRKQVIGTKTKVEKGYGHEQEDTKANKQHNIKNEEIPTEQKEQHNITNEEKQTKTEVAEKFLFALDFLDQVGDIIRFPNLPDYIYPSPEILINSCKLLYSHDLQNEIGKDEAIGSEEAEAVCKRGFVSTRLLRIIFERNRSSFPSSTVLNPTDLVEFLSKLGIVYPIPSLETVKESLEKYDLSNSRPLKTNLVGIRVPSLINQNINEFKEWNEKQKDENKQMVQGQIMIPRTLYNINILEQILVKLDKWSNEHTGELNLKLAECFRQKYEERIEGVSYIICYKYKHDNDDGELIIKEEEEFRDEEYFYQDKHITFTIRGQKNYTRHLLYEFEQIDAIKNIVVDTISKASTKMKEKCEFRLSCLECSKANKTGYFVVGLNWKTNDDEDKTCEPHNIHNFKTLLDDCRPSTCSICLAKFVEPVDLQCGHTFCWECIFKHCKTVCIKYKLEWIDSNDVPCPTCRKPITTISPAPGEHGEISQPSRSQNNPDCHEEVPSGPRPSRKCNIEKVKMDIENHCYFEIEKEKARKEHEKEQMEHIEEIQMLLNTEETGGNHYINKESNIFEKEEMNEDINKTHSQTTTGVQSRNLPPISTATKPTAVATSSTSQGFKPQIKTASQPSQIQTASQPSQIRTASHPASQPSVTVATSTNQGESIGTAGQMPDYEQYFDHITAIKGVSKVGLKNNFKIALDTNNHLNSVTFKAEFPPKNKVEKMINIMKKNKTFPCGPMVYFHDLVDARSHTPINNLQATLSLRHYLYLPERSNLLTDEAKKALDLKHDKHFFVSFDNNLEYREHDYKTLSSHSAEVDISSFSYWCFAGRYPCDHMFLMKIYLMRVIEDRCPHMQTQLYFVASGDAKGSWKEANAAKEMWDNPIHIEKEFHALCDSQMEELAARPIIMSFPSCHNEFDIEVGMKPDTSRGAQVQWHKCGQFSIRNFIKANVNGSSVPMTLKKEFPIPNCEKASFSHNQPYLRLQPTDQDGWFQKTLKWISSEARIEGQPSQLFDKEGNPILIQNYGCKNNTNIQSDKPVGIAFIVGNSYKNSKSSEKINLKSCQINADNFEMYLNNTIDLKYKWVPQVEKRHDITRQNFIQLLQNSYGKESNLAKEAQAICLYISAHGFFDDETNTQYIVFEDDNDEEDRLSVKEIVRLIKDQFPSTSDTNPKYYVLIFECCRHPDDNFLSIERNMELKTPDYLESTNNNKKKEQIFVLWSTQQGDESSDALLDGEQSTFSKELLHELKQKTKWNKLAGKINKELQITEGQLCSAASTGDEDEFERF